jgi:hypothetical protein
MWSDKPGQPSLLRERPTPPTQQCDDRRYLESNHHSFYHHYHLACYEKKVRADEREAWPTPMADVHQVLRPVPSQDGGRYLRCHQTAFPPIAAMRPERQS